MNEKVPMPPVKPPRTSDTIIIPTTPPRALLVSMAMRLRHDFHLDRIDGHPLSSGLAPAEREALLGTMAQIYEEVAGKGFYRWSQGEEQRGGLYTV